MTDPNAVRLIAQAEIPTVEVTILDSRLQVVHGDVGEVDVSLPPGTYVLQYRMGTSVTEVPVVLRPGVERVTVPAPTLSTRTPAPLAGSPSGDRYGAFARERSREVHERHAQGGQLFVFVRRATKDMEVQASTDSLFDVRLLDAQMNVVVDLRRAGQRSDDSSAIACNVELAPGSYVLRYTGGASDLLEQTVVVSPGWQTLIFASSRRSESDPLELLPSFADAALFVAPQGDGFDPSDRQNVKSESARLALAGSCRVGPEGRLRDVDSQASPIRASVPAAQADKALRSHFQNPMLGVYGAHLLLLNATPNWDVIRDIVSVLESLVGKHPDVVALTMQEELHDAAGDAFYELPPMLRNSWTLVIANSAVRPGLVPANAYAARIAKRVRGSGVWLTWRPPTAEDSTVFRLSEALPAAPTDDEIRRGMALLHAYVLETERALGRARFVKKVVADRNLTDTQRALLGYVIGAVLQNKTFQKFNRPDGVIGKASAYVVDVLQHYAWADRLTGGLRADALVGDHFAPERLVLALGVPAAALNQAIVTLAQKLRDTTVAAKAERQS